MDLPSRIFQPTERQHRRARHHRQHSQHSLVHQNLASETQPTESEAIAMGTPPFWSKRISLDKKIPKTLTQQLSYVNSS